jgi:hypothetical protein
LNKDPYEFVTSYLPYLNGVYYDLFFTSTCFSRKTQKIVYAAYSMLLIFSLLCSLEAITFRNLLVIWYLVAQFFAKAVSSAFLVIATPMFGLTGIWAGLVLFMSLRASARFWG